MMNGNANTRRLCAKNLFRWLALPILCIYTIINKTPSIPKLRMVLFLVKGGTASSSNKKSSSRRRLADKLKPYHNVQGQEDQLSTGNSQRSLLSCPNTEMGNQTKWTQVGYEINRNFDRFGSSNAVALSTDGKVIAVVAEGTVRIFHRNDFSCHGWVQVGQDLHGIGSKKSVALSDDGDMVAFAGGGLCYCVRIFQRNTSTTLGWSQVGQDITGEPDASIGSSIAISGTGDIIAIGAPLKNDGDVRNWFGTTRIYERDPLSDIGWLKIGEDLDGEIHDFFGSSVALSDAGNVVAIGGWGYDNGTGLNVGYVKVYARDRYPNRWVQLGQDIIGEGNSNFFGTSVSLSDDGSVLAIGGPGNSNGNGYRSGHVAVYSIFTDYDDDDDFDSIRIYEMKNFKGEAGGDGAGHSVALSGNGEILAIGAIHNHGSVSNSGHVRVYRKYGKRHEWKWVQVGDDIDGKIAGDWFGNSLSLSHDGKLVAIGNANGNVRVFQACDETDSPPPQLSCPPSQEPSMKPSLSPKCPQDPNENAKFWTGKFNVQTMKPVKKKCKWLKNLSENKIKFYCSMTKTFNVKNPAKKVCTGTCSSLC